MNDIQPIKRVLVSVYDKTGLEVLCRILLDFGASLFSTGGTADFIRTRCGVDPIPLESITQFPELMGGRVKTLHPKVFGGILARTEEPTDLEEARKWEIPLFDLVIVNLYPFWDHKALAPDKQVPYIDIGGVALIRAAAKNFDRVTLLSHPSDYSGFIEEATRQKGATSRTFRFQGAAKAFSRTSEYDSLIHAEWNKSFSGLAIPPEKLRYGENPHQEGFWCATEPKQWTLLQGKELSYNNLLDADCAVRLVADLAEGACAIVKHNNPCGVAIGKDLTSVYERALESNPKSAFGGIAAVNSEVGEELAIEMAKTFLEVIVAPKFSSGALKVFSQKKNLRLISWPNPSFPEFEIRPAMGGNLMQSRDKLGFPASSRVVTTRQPTESQYHDLHFSWIVCKHVRSNAIVIALGGRTLGIGAGQMSRVGSVEIAINQYLRRKQEGSVLAGDAFFPFRDNIDLLKNSKISALIQPGGSQRDSEVIEACNELGIAMVFTGERHFRH